jgi:hypothetical protein
VYRVLTLGFHSVPIVRFNLAKITTNDRGGLENLIGSKKGGDKNMHQRLFVTFNKEDAVTSDEARNHSVEKVEDSIPLFQIGL